MLKSVSIHSRKKVKEFICYISNQVQRINVCFLKSHALTTLLIVNITNSWQILFTETLYKTQWCIPQVLVISNY